MITRRTILQSALWSPLAAASLPVWATADDMTAFVAELPKAEYHLHLEGTLEAEMKFALAKRNGLNLPFADVAAMKASYTYHDLPSFLAIYYDGMKVLLKEPDFYDLTLAYLKKAASQNILYAEMFFDPQEHMKRGVPMAAIIGGISRARADAQKQFGIRSQAILCFVRDLPADTAMAALDAALPMKEQLVGIGMDSDEKGHPPIKFRAHIAKARANGLRVTAHCDVNQLYSVEHIRQAIFDLEVDRIDHGGNILQSPELVDAAKALNLPFTVCPTFSGTVKADGKDVDIVRGMLNAGLNVTISSDDPAYMGSEYLNAVLGRAVTRSALTRAELVGMSRNAFNAAWLPAADRAGYLATLDAFAKKWGIAV